MAWQHSAAWHGTPEREWKGHGRGPSLTSTVLTRSAWMQQQQYAVVDLSLWPDRAQNDIDLQNLQHRVPHSPFHSTLIILPIFIPSPTDTTFALRFRRGGGGHPQPSHGPLLPFNPMILNQHWEARAMDAKAKESRNRRQGHSGTHLAWRRKQKGWKRRWTYGCHSS